MANDDGQPAEGWLTLHQCARLCAGDEFLHHRQWTAAVVYDLAERFDIPLALEGELQNRPAAEVYSAADGKLHRLRIEAIGFIRLQTAELEHTNAILRAHGRLPTWADVFSADMWCPLYGVIPRPANTAPSTPAGQLFDIIVRARQLLPCDPDVPTDWLPEPEFDVQGWCPETVYDEPPDAVTRIARRLVGPGWLHVLQYTQHYGGARWVDGEDGPIYSHRLDQLPEPWALEYFAKSAVRFAADDEMREAIEEMRTPEWLALLAIGQAFHTLWYLLEDGDSQRHTAGILTATGLLAKAEAGAAADSAADELEQIAGERDTAAAERDALAPDAERGRRVLAGAADAGRATAERFNPERTAWRAAAAEILKSRQHRQPSVLELARMVAARLRPELDEAALARLADSRRRWLTDLLR